MYWKLPCDLEKAGSFPCCHFGMFCSYYSAAFLQPGEDTVYPFDPLRALYADLGWANVCGNQKESFHWLISQTDRHFVILPTVHKNIVSFFLSLWRWLFFPQSSVFWDTVIDPKQYEETFCSLCNKTVNHYFFSSCFPPPHTVNPLCLDSVSATFVCIIVLHSYNFTSQQIPFEYFPDERLYWFSPGGQTTFSKCRMHILY